DRRPGVPRRQGPRPRPRLAGHHPAPDGPQPREADLPLPGARLPADRRARQGGEGPPRLGLEIRAKKSTHSVRYLSLSVWPHKGNNKVAVLVPIPLEVVHDLRDGGCGARTALSFFPEPGGFTLRVICAGCGVLIEVPINFAMVQGQLFHAFGDESSFS